MARIFTTGFELNTLANGLEFFRNVGSQTGAIVTSPVRSGSYSYRNKPVLSAQNLQFQFMGAGTKTIFIRFYYYVVTHPASGTAVFVLLAGDGSTVIMILRGTGSGLRAMNAQNTQVGADFALNMGQWYRIELKVFSNSSTGTIDVLVDGVSVVSVTGVNTGGSDTQVVQWGTGASVTHEYYVDDIAINDGTGSFQTSYPGSGKVISQRPAGAGDSAQWARGGTDSGANWSQTNEVTPNDATNYVSANLLATSDLYTVTASGIGSADTVNVVHVGMRFTSNVGDVNVVLKVQCEKESGGTKAQSIGFTSANTVWRSNGTSQNFNVQPLILHQDPDNVNWTQATLDSMQIGHIISTGGSSNIRVSTVWTQIDYTPVSVQLKTVNGLPLASIKTFGGTSKSLVKTYNGLTVQ